jgi:hypothetical protein
VSKERSSVKGIAGVHLPIDLQAGNVTLKVVPWIGGRIVSMIHVPSGYEWLEGRFESGCYEVYSGHEFRSAGCTEEYQVVKYYLFTRNDMYNVFKAIKLHASSLLHNAKYSYSSSFLFPEFQNISDLNANLADIVVITMMISIFFVN